ncbi:MAG: hypothetical protein PHN31_00705 [Candidatus Gracilibacteria bacterium]|nr:hypothetical protein [Candidatus Gracilibacteria bacterium]
MKKINLIRQKLETEKNEKMVNKIVNFFKASIDDILSISRNSLFDELDNFQKIINKIKDNEEEIQKLNSDNTNTTGNINYSEISVYEDLINILNNQDIYENLSVKEIKEYIYKLKKGLIKLNNIILKQERIIKSSHNLGEIKINDNEKIDTSEEIFGEIKIGDMNVSEINDKDEEKIKIEIERIKDKQILIDNEIEKLMTLDINLEAHKEVIYNKLTKIDNSEKLKGITITTDEQLNSIFLEIEQIEELQNNLKKLITEKLLESKLKLKKSIKKLEGKQIELKEKTSELYYEDIEFLGKLNEINNHIQWLLIQINTEEIDSNKLIEVKFNHDGVRGLQESLAIDFTELMKNQKVNLRDKIADDLKKGKITTIKEFVKRLNTEVDKKEKDTMLKMLNEIIKKLIEEKVKSEDKKIMTFINYITNRHFKIETKIRYIETFNLK